MCFENGLPRQSADWLAMTGFFDSLKGAPNGETFPQAVTNRAKKSVWTVDFLCGFL